MRILFDSKSTTYKKPFGCIRQGELCTLRIDIPCNCRALNVRLCIFDETGFEMLMPFKKTESTNGYDLYETEFSLFHTGLYFYYFRIEAEESNFSLYKQGRDTNIEEGDLWQLTCYNKDYDTPDCFKGRVMYQIFPDRFSRSENLSCCDNKLMPYFLHDNLNDLPIFLPDKNGIIQNNDFFGGNLKGIENKLDYLSDIGVGVIYLNPIFMAYSNHRYDTADYMKIDPLLGTEQDFIDLCTSAHKKDIKIILDGVFSHTGSNSIYFDKNNIFGSGAYTNENSPYRSWYDFQEYPDKYTSWWGIDTLPCVNEMDSSFMDYIINNNESVIAHWLRAGADGFRLDVADELPDEFILAIQKRIKEIKPDALLIGEVWEDASNKISYSKRRKYFSESELDSVMNYPFKNWIIAFVKGELKGNDFAENITTILENYPEPVVNCLMNMLSTHDTRRILTEIGDDNLPRTKEQKAVFFLDGEEFARALALSKIAAVLQFMLPGMPCIYYGDEIAMQGYEDPLNRGYFKWDCINNELLEFYTKLSALKNKYLSIKKGSIEFKSCHDNFISFARNYDNETIYITVVLGEKIQFTDNTLFEFKSEYASVIIYK